MKKITLGIILIVLVIIFVLIMILTPPERSFNQYEFTKNNYVLNTTKPSYLDTILHIGLNELDIKDVAILIEPMPDSYYIEGNWDLGAFVIGNKAQFIIFIKDFNRATHIDVLSHELIHIKQYNDGRLKHENGCVTWKEHEYTDAEVMDIPYDQREWEIEAFMEGRILSKKIREKLY